MSQEYKPVISPDRNGLGSDVIEEEPEIPGRISLPLMIKMESLESASILYGTVM